MSREQLPPWRPRHRSPGAAGFLFGVRLLPLGIRLPEGGFPRALHAFLRDCGVQIQPQPGSLWFTHGFYLAMATNAYKEGLARLREVLTGMPADTA